jgi:hypothetical protein
MKDRTHFAAHGRSMLAVAGLALVTMAACSSSDEPLMPDHCNIQLADISPPSLILVAGDTSTLRATILASADCLPPGTTAEHLRWFSSNEATVAVDSIAGTVTAVATGSATISLRTAGYPTTLATANVAVNVP